MATSEQYLMLTNDGLFIVLDGDLKASWSTLVDSGGYYATDDVESALQDVGQELLEHNLGGWEDASAVALSTDSGTPPTITLTFTGTVYYWAAGVRYSKSGTDTIQIANTSGTTVIYYNGDTLSQQLNPSHAQIDEYITDHCIVAITYWNANNSTAPILAYETHGLEMSGETHHWLHDNIGAVWKSGGTLSGYVINDGDDASITFQLTDCEFYDEDIEIEIEDAEDASGQYEQILSGVPAQLPVLYRDATDQSWVEQAASIYPYVVGGNNRPMYMDEDDSYIMKEIPNNDFCNYWIVATNDWQYPFKTIPGTQVYPNQNQANQNAHLEIVNWGALPGPEFVIMYRLLLKAQGSETYDIRIVEVTDYRGAQLSGSSALASDHGTLSGLADDDHAQYLLIDGTRAMTGTLYIGDTGNTKMTLGLTIDQLSYDDEILAFKSSDIAHGVTGRAETDTYGFMRKAVAASGGLHIAGLGTHVLGLEFQAIPGSYYTSKGAGTFGAVNFDIYHQDGTTVKAPVANSLLLSIRAGGSTVWVIDEDGDSWQSGDATFGSGINLPTGSGITWGDVGEYIYGLNSQEALIFVTTSAERVRIVSSGLYVNETAINTNMGVGITVNQGANDDEILAFKSSDVAHGMTALTETDTYAWFQKAIANSGGINIRAATEVGLAIQLAPFYVTGDTTKSTAGIGAVSIDAYERDGAGPGVVAPSADVNILSIRAGGSTKWIVDEDGTTWQDGDLTLGSTKLTESELISLLALLP